MNEWMNGEDDRSIQWWMSMEIPAHEFGPV